VFLIGSVIAGILFENHPGGRIAVFVLILAFVLGYEPFMVARYGGTFGHRKANIRISCARTDANLPFWRAAARSLVKQVFGIFSFFFMFITHRGQGLHDLIAGATVIISNPLAARPEDYFFPKPQPTGQPASPIRRVGVTVLYNLLLFVFVAVVASMTVSPSCLNQNDCLGADDLILSILGGGWLILCIVSIILGWTGRLPGCRHRARP
jgi:RDD family